MAPLGRFEFLIFFRFSFFGVSLHHVKSGIQSIGPLMMIGNRAARAQHLPRFLIDHLPPTTPYPNLPHTTTPHHQPHHTHDRPSRSRWGPPPAASNSTWGASGHTSRGDIPRAPRLPSCPSNFLQGTRTKRGSRAPTACSLPLAGPFGSFGALSVRLGYQGRAHQRD